MNALPALDFTSLSRAVQSLEESLFAMSDTEWLGRQSSAVRNTLMAGVIQNFEFVYELSVKMLRRQLELEAASPEEVDHSSFRHLLRTAGERGLIADVDAWFQYRQMRNLTAHTYDHDKAQQVFQGVERFLSDARALLAQLKTRRDA